MPQAIFVGWWNVPVNKVVAFYETTDCTYKHGHFTFNTGSTRSRVTGMHYFEDGPKRIRSLMLGRNEDALLQEAMKATTVSRSCKLHDWYDSASLDANMTLANSTSVFEWAGGAGGLSANWTDVLPDISSQSSDSLGAGDNAGANP
ncbi:hypothetical protein F442_21973 [Phytophthora nicotianae P10297]|uniref:Uncharacterized protein n=7 Tax=Phytophthora nicotianae TaxID=4792 RepID=W2R6N5_PHYN3|nr:hypothetical protein PPTG_21027 [Phytophthora nicotianae INRA-310]ETI30776.1 hypothetical protein F443_22109 [Phytophthora nicotianae P1569]ETN20896.1 hypothetical protein PPTG_21027 [Phytophthora nicotianae INRA-310]ETO74472.1 hypothetical protein F444_09813 [Phytophthora nicotianae P1976]ETP28734.1 hypothetical protein F442_21973 [Phytophthora nicotianae P10297]